MSEKKETPCKITELINNKLSKFTEDNREWLGTLDEATFDLLIPDEPKLQTNKKSEEDDGKALQEPKKEEKPQTLDEYLEGVPEGIRGSMRAGLKLHEEQREKMIKGILANTEKGIWNEDDLKVMETDTLKKVFDSVPVGNVDFSILGNSTIQDNEDEPGILPPPGVKEEEVKTEGK